MPVQTQALEKLPMKFATPENVGKETLSGKQVKKNFAC